MYAQGEGGNDGVQKEKATLYFKVPTMASLGLISLCSYNFKGVYKNHRLGNSSLRGKAIIFLQKGASNRSL